MKQSLIQHLLITLALLLGAMSAASAADRFYLDAVNIEPGETTDLTFNLDNEQTIYGFQADVALPEGVAIITTSSDKAEITLSERCDGSYVTVSNLLASNVVRLGAFSTSHAAISGESGALFSLKVKADDDFAGGTLSVSNIFCTAENDRDVELPDFSIELGNRHSDNFYIPDFKAFVDQTKTVAIILDNETPFTAFQTDIYLPEGIIIVPDSFELTSRGSSGHSISTKFFDDGRTRIACFSQDNEVFSGNSGDLLTFELTAIKEAAEKSVIELKNQIFTTANAREYVLPNSITNVTTEIDNTGVGTITMDDVNIKVDNNRIFISELKSGVTASLFSLDGVLIRSTVGTGAEIVFAVQPNKFYVLNIDRFSLKLYSK
ncbi:MAG: hypothetical protein K2M19_04100 [Muribaculaceae bacterium]|nr:hypothetical protein [Muribaculaceae bacterium]